MDSVVFIRPGIMIIAAGIAASLGGCAPESSRPDRNTGKDAPPDVVNVADSASARGDLDEIRKRGYLRVLTPWITEGYLPRSGYPADHERELAELFARKLGMRSVIVSVERFEDLAPALAAGRGDIIAANLAVTEARRKTMAFTLPLDQSVEQVVARGSDNSLRFLSDLAGRTIAVQAQTSFHETAEALRRKVPGLRVSLLPGRLSTDEILDRVAEGGIDLTIMDSNLLAVLLTFRSDVKAVLDASGTRDLAWAVRPDNPQLLAALNDFLQSRRAARRQDAPYREDFPGIRKRGKLRVLTPNTAATYFQWRGELMGFEYEMARRFATKHGLELEIIVPPQQSDMIPMLLAGRADFIAAALTPTAARRAMNIAFSIPYIYATQMVVACSSERKLKSPADLAGRTIHVRRSSSYRGLLERLQAEGLRFKLADAPESMTTEEIIAKVAAREYDLTLADSHILDIESVWQDARGAFPIGAPEPCCWVVRAGDKELLAAINSFWAKEYRGEFYNIAFKKYFRITPKKAAHIKSEMAPAKGRISKYDDLVKHFAERYGFEWRMNVAQMYQESRFDPRAKSSTGAKGLFQVMPSTAREMGFHQDLENPPVGIHAGIKYLDFVRSYCARDLPPSERIWFALASYNAGPGHVNDARRLARQLGLNPNAWFGNVEKAMLLLSKPQYARQARYGYVRGIEPVTYVREIRDRHAAYTQAVGD